MEPLNQLCEGVWAAETTTPLGLGVRLPLRMTVLRAGPTPDSGLVLVSPIPIDEQLAAALAALGTVEMVLGPNRLHHLHLAAAQTRYPAAKLLGAPGLSDKRSDLAFTGVLRSGTLSPAIEALEIAGADKLSEVVLWHRPSKTLVVTDLVFNIVEASGLSKVVVKYVSGTFGRMEQSRLLRGMTNDRAAAARSVAQLLEWPCERVVMAHGQVVEGQALERLRSGLWWWLGARRTA